MKLKYFSDYMLCVDIVATKNCKCRDTLSVDRVATISITKHGETFNKDVTDCQELPDYFPQFCADHLLGGKKNSCCKSCLGVGKL